MKAIKIGDRLVGPAHEPLIIAELSGNHNGSLERALALIDAAAEAGVQAIKLQTFTADTITLDSDAEDFRVHANNEYWGGQTLHSLYKKSAMPWEWHQPVFDRARQHGLLPLSSVFDESSVDFLETLDVPVYKIASFENNHLPLLRKVAATGKPIIISTGVTELADIDEAVRTVREAGCENLILLQCTSSYPASPKSSNLSNIPYLAKIFDCVAGLSDHTLGIGVSVAAVAMGARVIEKHFTLDRNDGGVDSAFSLEPHELKSLAIESKRAFEALGVVNFGMTEKEKHNRAYKRSIYVSKAIAEGELLTAENLKIVRPGRGLHSRYWDTVIGRRTTKSLTHGTALTWDAVVGEE